MNQLYFMPKFLVTIIILHLFSNINAKALGQDTHPGEMKVTIVAKTSPLHEVFRSITKQTGLRFSYNNNDVDKNEVINAPFIDMTVDRVLKHIFAGKAISWTYIDNIVRIGKANKDQGPSIVSDVLTGKDLTDSISLINITGQVTDPKGKPVVGATVSLRGFNRGQGTDNTGKFSFSGVQSNAVLVISSIGFDTKQVKIGGSSNIKIILEQTITNIEGVEIVSTGYQNIPKERATGSFIKIDNATLNQQVGTSVLDRLNGVTSGVLFNVDKLFNNPRDKTGITIRGLSTISGPLDPLIVLDDFIYEGSFNNINPNDIESITVLRDAAATSIYGARGGNGVIVLTTKKGKFNQKTKIEFNSNIIVGERPDLYSLPQIASSDFIDVEQLMFNNGYKLTDTNNINRPALSPVYEILLKRRKGLISPADSAAQINALKAVDSRDQFMKYFYRNAVTQQYALNIRGGGSNIAWMLSGGYDKVISDLDAKSDKINIRFYNEYKPIEKLTVSVGAYYTNSNFGNGKPAYNNSIRVGARSIPYTQFADANGKPLSVATTLRDIYTDTAGAGKLFNWKYYPLEDYKHNTTDIKREELVANLGVNYKILSGLSVDLKYQYQRQNDLTETLADMESYAARNMINTYSQLNRATGVVKYGVPVGGILDNETGTVNSHNLRGQINFNKTWGDHEVYAIAGGEMREAVGKGNRSRTYGYNSDPLTYGKVDFVTLYPTFITGGSASISGSPTSYFTTNRFISLYANVSYSWRRKYTFTVSGRRDGSNIFGANTNDKWKPLWSTGLAWDISKENFYNIGLIPYLKIRGTYGYSGNIDLSKSALPVAQFISDGATGLPAAVIRTLNNPELSWEQVGQLNIGVDFASKRNVISGSIDYYKKRSTDLYGLTPYDYTTWGGTASITRNVADISATGVDVVINSKNMDRAVKWNTNFLASFYRDKTLKYYTAQAEKVNGLIGNGLGIMPVIGKPLYSIAAYRWGGLDNTGDPLGYVNGQKSKDYKAIFDEGVAKGAQGNIVYIGTTTPTVFGSLQNHVSWKNFTLSAIITYKMGYYFKKPTISYDGLVSTGLGHSDFAKRWKKPGDELITNVPSMKYPQSVLYREDLYLNAEIHVLKADHIRFQTVNLSYSFNKNNIKKLPFQEIQVYANIANLGILWRANKEGIDPDYSYSIPIAKTYAFGIRGSF